MNETATPDPERRQRTMKLLAVSVLAAILVVVVLIVVSQSGDEGGDTSIEGGESVATQLEGLPQDGSVIGDEEAPVTIIEYADLQCPVCQIYDEEVVPGLLEGAVADGAAKIDFRNWAILGRDSKIAARATLAAGKQDRMWDFVELFYDNQGIEGTGFVTDAFLESIARDAGLDIEQWQQDRSDPALAAELAAIDNQAIADGFNGTPSIVVEGPAGRVPLKGVPTLNQVGNEIDRQLQTG